MKEMNAVYLLLVFLVYVTNRKHREYVPQNPLFQKSVPDTVREMLGKKLTLPPYVPYVLALAPLYLGYNHADFPKIFEHGLVLFVMFLFVRSVQILNNKESRPLVEPTFPALNLVLLLFVYHGIIERKHLSSAYLYALVQMASVLVLNPKNTTLSSMMDDFALAHLLFYVFK